MQALIDTGAMWPVFSFTDYDMKAVFGATRKRSSTIEGFGGVEKGSIYSISKFPIGSIIFEPFEVFVPEILRMKHPMVLSATMFYGTDYEFDTINNVFTVTMDDNYETNRPFKMIDIKGKSYPQIQTNDIMLLFDESGSNMESISLKMFEKIKKRKLKKKKSFHR